MFLTKVRGTGFEKLYVIVPSVAMSAGSLLVLLSDGLLAPRKAILGPVDPQLILQTPFGPRVIPAISLKRLIEETLPNLAKEKGLDVEGLTRLYIAQDLLAYQAAIQSLEYMENVLEREVKEKLSPEAYEELRRSFLSEVRTHGKPLDPTVLQKLGFPVTVLNDDKYGALLKLIERYDALCQKTFLFEPGLKTLLVGSKLGEIILGVEARPPTQPPKEQRREQPPQAQQL